MNGNEPNKGLYTMLFAFIISIIATLVVATMGKWLVTRKRDKNGNRITKPLLRKGVVPVFTGVLVMVTAWVGFNGIMFYAEPGFKYHVRTILGHESMVQDVGYNVRLFGSVNAWKNAMTVQALANVGSLDASSAENGRTTSASLPLQNLVFLDQVDADVAATVRFQLPDDNDAFLRLARQYRTPENLLRTELIPAFQETLGATAALMGAEEYFSGGKTQFNNSFENQMRDGVYEVRRQQIRQQSNVDVNASANASLGAEQSPYGNNNEVVFRVSRVLDSNGQPKRKTQAFNSFGITIVSARVTSVQPNTAFRDRMMLKQEASANRAIAQERRAQEVQERLLAIEKGEREVAERQAEAKVRQIEVTTNAETDKQLALTQASQRLEQAEIDRQTSEINLARAEIEAEARVVAADAEAYEKEALLAADNALAVKMSALIDINKVWAEAYSSRKVPSIVFGAGQEGGQGSDTDITNFLQLMTVQAARDLNVDPSIK